MFWTDWGTVPKIERAHMNGHGQTTIVSGDLSWPNGLVIDEASQTLFWADAGLDKIETSDLTVKYIVCFFFILFSFFSFFDKLGLMIDICLPTGRWTPCIAQFSARESSLFPCHFE